MNFAELIDAINAQLTGFSIKVGNDITSENIIGQTSFKKGVGVYVNSPDAPWTSGTIPLNTTGLVKGGISTIWYKGPVLSKSSFTGGVVTMFSGVNVLNELCRVFIDCDAGSGAFSVNIQTGFTGDLPSGPITPPTGIPAAPTNLVLTQSEFVIGTTPAAPTNLVLTEGTI